MKRLVSAPLSARWRRHARHAGWLCALGSLGGCAVGTNMGLLEVKPANVAANATLTPSTRITRDLVRLPPPRFRVPVAVYAFRDQTGQFKPSPDSNLSTSVTQGAATILVKSLLDSGWYLPIEREGFQNLLNERRVARAIETPADKGKPGSAYPQLVSASFIIEGGIVGFESNVRTGGDGASLLGIGGSTRYRVDQVTVNLRSVDVRTGQIANSVSVTKTIYSYEVTASVYKFIAYKTLLQAEGGFTSNEPSQLAVKEAIESAVIHLTVQGVRDRIWALNDDKDWLQPVVQTYAREADNELQDPDAARERASAPVPMRQPALVMASPTPLGLPGSTLAGSSAVVAATRSGQGASPMAAAVAPTAAPPSTAQPSPAVQAKVAAPQPESKSPSEASAPPRQVPTQAPMPEPARTPAPDLVAAVAIIPTPVMAVSPAGMATATVPAFVLPSAPTPASTPAPLPATSLTPMPAVLPASVPTTVVAPAAAPPAVPAEAPAPIPDVVPTLPPSAPAPARSPAPEMALSAPIPAPVLAPPDRLAARQEAGPIAARALAFQLLRAPLLPPLQFPEPVAHATEDRPMGGPLVAPPDQQVRSEPDDDVPPAWTKASLP